MLLTMQENGAGGKGDMLPNDWFKEKPLDYLETHSIPADQELWRLDRFEDFIDARKTLLRERFKALLMNAPATEIIGSAV